MALDGPAIAWLLAADGQTATDEASSALAAGTALHSVIASLRHAHEPDHARWAVTLAEGRLAARTKFADASSLYFDREAAEQATSETVATHTARRFANAKRIADLGCGGGGDALALAEHADVIAIDLDAGRIAMTEANAAQRGLTVHTSVSDLRDMGGDSPLLDGVDAVWLDPARRDSSGRVLDPRRWSPPLTKAIHLARQFRQAGIKVAPGIDLQHVPEDAEIEFISLGGILVEAVIWLGEAVSAPRRASVLPQRISLAGRPDNGATPVLPPGDYLYDLDPSIGRASLVDLLAPSLEAWLLAPEVAYLSGDRAVDSPFARRFRIVRWLPYAERRILDACREAGAGRVEVMRRASPVDTNALEIRLNQALDRTLARVLTIALTRSGSEHIAILCERERDSRP